MIRIDAVRRLGPFEVSAIGLGCMSLSYAYGQPPEPAQAERLLLGALERGVRLFDTAALYGFGANETLIGRVLGPHRARFVLASKCGLHGVDGRRVLDGRPETIRRSCDESLQRLRTDVIDLMYLHRRDRSVPIEDSVGALADLVRAGKVRTIGLSEVSAGTLERAHAVHPVTALQNEYSLWSRNAELGTLEACRRLGVAFVAFSPLARAVLAGGLRDPQTLHEKDLRRTMPRFAPGHWPANLQLADAFAALAREAGCAPSQLALAWLLARGSHVIPIPGTTSLAHLEENLGAAALALDPAVLERAGALVDTGTVSGPRYAPASYAEVDTERLPGEDGAAA